jgi:D-glycero-D-manno-heptose 1,7-bisphosphate phosphatase
VFLDRDGVLNAVTVDEQGVPHPPAGLADLQILPGVPRACEVLRRSGFMLIGVTNQPDVARGTATREGVEAINRAVAEAVGLDALYTCWHDNADNCLCRKPKPGLLLQAASDYNIDLGSSFMVGDRWSDIAAGAAAGCRTFLLERPYSRSERCCPDWVVPSLLDAARILCERLDAQDTRASLR